MRLKETCRLAAIAGFGALLVGFASAGAPAQDRPAAVAPLARFFPGDDLAVYVEFDGLNTHADAWHKTAAYRLMNETPTGRMLREVFAQLVDQAFAKSPGPRLSGTEVTALTEHAFRSGFAFAINKRADEAKPTSLGLVVRGAAVGPPRATIDRLFKAMESPSTKVEVAAKAGDRKVTTLTESRGGGIAWWAEGDDLAVAVVSPHGADAMIDALDGRRPNAVANATRADLAKPAAGFLPIGVAFVDVTALPKMPPRAVALGLDRVRRLEYRWGFQDTALMTVVRLVAPAPRAGILGLFDQPSFGPGNLPPVPAGLAGFTVFSVEPARLFDQFAATLRAGEPNGQGAVDSVERTVLARTGLRLRDDILKPLGPTATLFALPTKINAPTNALAGLARGIVHVPKSAFVLEVHDATAAGKALDVLAARANEAFKAEAERTNSPAGELRPLKGNEKGYTLFAPPSLLPLAAGSRPTVLLGKKTLVIGSTPAAARQALALESRAKGPPPGDALAEAAGPDRLPPKMTLLTITDTAQSMLPDVVANLPGLIQMIGTRDPGAATPLLGFLRRGFPLGRAMNPGGRPGFVLKIDPDDVPSPDELRPFLFPAAFTFNADDDGLTFTSREAFPALNPTTAAPVAVALMLPAVQSARSAARRAQSTNNLKQMGLALHNFLSVNNNFPPGSVKDKDGKPLLSWRVAILPFVEQAGLFNEFKLDEPWDSEHNKKLLERMPAVFEVPGAKADPGTTFYRGFSGPGTLFDPRLKDGVGIATVTDGTSNTIGIVEAREAVPWTKPDSDIALDEIKPEDAAKLSPMLGGHFPGGFNALFLDGSVRFIRDTINPTILRALITRDGGEVISSDSF